MTFFGKARNRYVVAAALVLSAAALLGSGCNRSSKTEDTAGNGDATDGPAGWPDASVKPTGGRWDGSIQVSTGDWKSFQKLIDSHKGKVIVAGFWASWSEKSIKQIRHLARLQNKYRGKIIVLHVAVDPETPRPDLEKLVRDWVGSELPQDERIQLFISTQVDEEFYVAAQTIEAVPTIFVYDRGGKRKKIFVGAEKVIDGGLHLVPVLDEMMK